jgi:hypothetical protein
MRIRGDRLGTEGASPRKCFNEQRKRKKKMVFILKKKIANTLSRKMEQNEKVFDYSVVFWVVTL